MTDAKKLVDSVLTAELSTEDLSMIDAEVAAMLADDNNVAEETVMTENTTTVEETAVNNATDNQTDDQFMFKPASVRDEGFAYGDFTKKQLIEEYNLRGNVDSDDDFGLLEGPEALRKKATKADIIERLEFDDHRQRTLDVPASIVAVELGTETLTLDKVVICPLNNRSELSYHDPDFYNAIVRSGGLTKNPSVFKATEIDPSADPDLWYTVAGNRSLATLKRLVVDSGLTLDSYEQDFSVRSYKGAPWQNKIQVLTDLVQDNVNAQQLTTFGKIQWIKDKITTGASNKEMATELREAQSQVSRYRKAGALLPDGVLRMLEINESSNLLSKLSDDELDSMNVAYVHTDEGLRVIPSMTQANAFTIMDVCFNKKPARYKFDSDDDYNAAMGAWEDHVGEVHEWLLTDEVMNMACDSSVTAPKFKTWIKKAVVEAGHIEARTKTSVASVTPPAVESSEPVVESSEETVTEAVEAAPESIFAGMIEHDLKGFCKSLRKADIVIDSEPEDVLALMFESNKNLAVKVLAFLEKNDLIKVPGE